jgi:hypothetical protein
VRASVLLLAAVVLAAPVRAQNPLDRGPPWSGAFGDESAGVGAVLFPAGDGRVEGAIIVIDDGERLYPATGTVQADGAIAGTFRVKEGESYPFQARAEDRGILVLTSDGSRFRLGRERGGPRTLADLRRTMRARAPLEGDEARVVDALRQLETAEAAFLERDADGDGVRDYGSLDELVAAKLVDPALARAPWCGYALEVRPSPLEPGARWAAVARPYPAREGARSFFVNHAGVIHHSSLPLTISADCEPPLVAVPLGEPEPDWDARGDPRSNEGAAIGALRALVTGEALFREGDKDGDGELDYGTLAELGKAQLVSRVLASGRSSGYLFELRVSATNPGFVWSATARPIEPGTTGTAYFFVNQTGAVWSGDRPFVLDDEAQPPAWATPLRR